MEARFIHGSSTDATLLVPDLVNQVKLIVTSPPYHNAISYKDHAKNPSLNYRTRYSLNYSGEYMKLLNEVWSACFEMLQPGGIIAINVGSVLDDGAHFPLAEDIIMQTQKTDKWQFVKSIFWNKVTAGVKRAGSVIQHPFPGYWHPNIMTEHIILMKKPGKSFDINSDVPRHWLEPVWDLAPVPPRTVEHPAPFPEDLPHRLIRMFTQEGDWVLDPFNGAGATTKAAFDLDRNSIGFDIEKKYIKLAKARLLQPSSVRSNQLQVIPVFSKLFVPGPSRGKTRQGAGKSRRSK